MHCGSLIKITRSIRGRLVNNWAIENYSLGNMITVHFPPLRFNYLGLNKKFFIFKKNATYPKNFVFYNVEVK